MPPSNAMDEPLGTKHKQFNKQVQDAIVNGKFVDEREFIKDNTDIENLMKIDIAIHNKDIDYILSVLKSDDILYVSRVIKLSLWLVDNQYSNIVNPKYLNEYLFPYMKTKAATKLLKHIRKHLKDESRVEEFYSNETKPKTAALWLSRCSVPFIESNIKKHMKHLSDLEFKRLCARSVTILEAAMKDYKDIDKLKAVSFLLHTHPDKYLDIFENVPLLSYCRTKFSSSTTELMMKKAPNRIISNFSEYVKHIHIPTFIESLKREQVKGFLLDLANKEEHSFRDVFNYKTMTQLVNRMPKEEQFQFVKNVFLNKDHIMAIKDEDLQRGTEIFAVKRICGNVCARTPYYHWYEYAPFHTAFEEIKKLLKADSNIEIKYSMFNVLLKSAAKNTKHLLDLLMFHSKSSSNDNSANKKDFLIKLLLQAEIYKRDEETWNTFIKIVNGMNCFTSDDNQEYIEIVLIHLVLHNKQVAETINKNFSFSTLIKYRKTLNEDEQNKLFEYLLLYLIKKIQGQTIQTEIQCTEVVQSVQNVLSLLINWGKELSEYPFALDKIKELVRISKHNGWKINLSSLYNKNKSWKRLMFEESLVMNPSQNVCVNALKHDPKLFERYIEEVAAICCNDVISLKQLLRKLKIYWPDTLADSWTKSYLGRLDKPGGHKALTRGLCTLLSQEPLLDIVKKYAPVHAKIDWNNTNELTLGLQRTFAKNMHIARPQPSADAILLYAKADFLQYALPSLLSIYNGMGGVESQEHIPKLLDAPVSLQKHGLRLAFIKLKHEELKFHLSNMWQTTKNISIRAVTFVLLFDLLCKEKDAERAKELWEILEVFINNLSFKEDKKIYLKLHLVKDVNETVKPKFLVKSYTFLKSLLPHLKTDKSEYEYKIQQLALYTKTIMYSMCPQFVEDILTEYLNDKFFNGTEDRSEMLGVTSYYLLCAKDEETQNKKYEKVLVPLIKRSLMQWNEMHEDKYIIRNNFQLLLNTLYSDLFEYAIKNDMIIPAQMFRNIGKELDTLPLPQNYLMIRMWKLVIKLTEIAEKNDNPENWQLGASELGKYCLEVLKNDVKTYFSCIYVLFAKVLRMAVKKILPEAASLQIYEVLLSDRDFIQAYLVVLQMLPDKGYYSNQSDAEKEKENQLKNLIYSHPSVEIRMHYHCKYSDETESLGM